MQDIQSKHVRFPLQVLEVASEVAKLVNSGSMNELVVDALLWYCDHYSQLLPKDVEKISNNMVRKRLRELHDININEQLEQIQALTNLKAQLIRFKEVDADMEDYRLYWINIRPKLYSFEKPDALIGKARLIFRKHLLEAKKTNKKILKRDVDAFKF